MLAFEGIAYRYAGAPAAAIRDVTLRLGEGDVVGLVGANEAGKSTLCLVASGLAPRTIGGELTGLLLLDGIDAASLAMHEMVERVGIVFQNPETQLSGVTATVYDEVAFGPSNLGVPLPTLIDRVDAALDDLGIGDLADRDPRRLSGGQMQLVALAGLLALRPKYLILDEPTAQLDPVGSKLVAAALVKLGGAGSSILIAEHKTDLLAQLCDRVCVLDAGRVVAEGPARAVLADPELEALGVAPPSGERLGRRLRDEGLEPNERVGTATS